jgi:Surface-adhesin protein E/SPOR domain
MRGIVALLLMALVSSARAEWLKYGESDNAMYYYDPSTITKIDRYTRVWQFQDFKKRAADGSMSIRFQSEYDCKGSRFRILSWRTHAQGMLRGKIVDRGGKLEQWVAIAPGTSPAALLEDVCRITSTSRSGSIEGAGAEAAQRNVEFIAQVAAFADPEKVKALTARLAEANIPYYTEPIETAQGPVTRVRVGPFANPAAADRALEALRGMGLEPGKVFRRSNPTR